MNWQGMIEFIGATGICIGALGWVAKTILSRWMTIDLERHKALLSEQTGRQIEEFRNDLRRVAFEHETRFAKAHERRAEVIPELYSKLVDAQSAFGSYAAELEFSNEPSKEEKAKTAAAAYDCLWTAFRHNRLFIEESICRVIDDLLRDMREVFHLMANEAKVSLGLRPQRENVDYWDKADDIMRKKVPPILKALEGKFRKIVGVPDEG